MLINKEEIAKMVISDEIADPHLLNAVLLGIGHENRAYWLFRL